MGNSIVHIEGNTLKVDDKDYELTPGLGMLILYETPRPQHYTSDDYSVYKAIVAQTSARAIQISVHALLDHAPHGNGNICSGVWLYLGMG